MIYMSWLNSWDEPFDPARHATELCGAYSLKIKEVAGQAATSTVEVDNPGIAGLLLPARRYAVFSERGPDDVVAVELARGRVVGVPSEFGTEYVTLALHSLPPEDDRVQRDVADELRTDDDRYDALFHGPDAAQDPSTAISARSVDWYWDRRTLAVRTTPLLSSARTVDLGSEALDDSLSMSLVEAPPRSLRRRLVFAWTQSSSGPQASQVGPHALNITTFTAADFMSSFPRPGDSIGSADTGWTWAEAECVDHGPGARVTIAAGGTGVAGAALVAEPRQLEIRLRARHDYEQQREEVVDIVLPLGLQPVLGDEREESVEVIQVAGLTTDETTPAWEFEDPETLKPAEYEVGDRVQARGRAWVCVRAHTVDGESFYSHDPVTNVTYWEVADRDVPLSAARGSYVETDRGARSANVALHMLEREAILQARCIKFSFEVPWALARDLTCDDSVRLATRYVSGGWIEGKVVEVELVADDAGTRIGRVVIATTPGLGLPPSPPDEEYDESTGDLVYKVSGPGVPGLADASSLRRKTPRIFELTNEGATQRNAMMISNDPEKALAARPTQLVVGYDPIDEIDLLSRRMRVTCRPLALPRQINLEGTA